MDEEGEMKPMFTISYSKVNNRFIAKPNMGEKETSYLSDMMNNIAHRANVFEKKRCKRHRAEFQLAPFDRPDKEDVISQSMVHKRMKIKK